MRDDQTRVQEGVATTDSDSPPALTLSKVDLARLMLGILQEFKAALKAAGRDRPESDPMPDFEVEQLGRSIADVDAGLDSLDANHLEDRILKVARRLAIWLQRETPAQSDAVVAYSRSRFEAWRLLWRSPDALVNFDGLLADVMNVDSIRLDAASVKLRTDVLSGRVQEQREQILGSVRSEVLNLEAARRSLEEFLATQIHRVASGAETPLTAETATDWRSDKGSTAGTVEGILANPDFVQLRQTHEARLLEAAATTNQLLHGAIERSSRAILSQFAANLRRTELQLATAEGLAQVIDERLEIRTGAANRLAELMRRMKGGSVGLAGPRGAGKSTIIRRFCDGREQVGDRPLLSVVVPAPVAYDSRDFMLHLFAEVCRSAGARPPPPEPMEEDGSGQPSGWILRRSIVWWLRILAIWLIIGGSAALVASVDDEVSDFVVWGGAANLRRACCWMARVFPVGHADS